MAASSAQIRANNKYNKKAYDRLEMQVPKGQKEAILAHAASRGESLNQFLKRSVYNQISIDNNDSSTNKNTQTEDLE